MTAVLRRALRTERRSLLGWVLGVAALVLVTAGSWPAVADSTDDLAQVLEDLPPALSAFFGEGIASFSAAAVVGSRLFGTIGLALFLGYAISRGARAIAGEEGEGTLELLVTQPLSRTSIAVAKVVATWLVLAGLVVLQQVLLLALVPVVGLDFGLAEVVAASAGLYLLAVLFGMLAFAVGSATGNRPLAVAVAAGSAAALFLLAGFGALVPWLADVAAYSPFARYDGTVVLAEGIDVGALGVFTVLAVVLVAIGIAAFDRRDLS